MRLDTDRFDEVADRAVLRVEVVAELAELAADVLWQAGPSAVSVEDGPEGMVRLVADVPADAALGGLPAGAGVAWLEVDADEHLDAWRAHAAEVRAGRHVVLRPAWSGALASAAEAGPDDVVVGLDPGRVFGSGSHPSTRLAISVLEDHLRSGERVLDVGAGSGVLAVTAVLLGAASAVAIDIDPASPAVVADNADRNGVGDRVAASTASLDELDGRFELVVANIGLGVLRALAAALERHVAPGGLLVLAGVLDDQTRPLVESFPQTQEVERRTEDGWSVVVLRVPG